MLKKQLNIIINERTVFKMMENNHKKGNILVTYLLPDTTDVTMDIDNELLIQQEIAKLMHKLVSEGIISHFSIADDDIISKKNN